MYFYIEPLTKSNNEEGGGQNYDSSRKNSCTDINVITQYKVNEEYHN